MNCSICHIPLVHSDPIGWHHSCTQCGINYLIKPPTWFGRTFLGTPPMLLSWALGVCPGLYLSGIETYNRVSLLLWDACTMNYRYLLHREWSLPTQELLDLYHQYAILQ
jgi:hypothetical protein